MQAEALDYERLMAGLKTKSDKIRALGRHGVPTAEIARYLGIRYQHARNVLVEAGLHPAAEDKAQAQTLSVAPAEFAWVDLDESGRITLPGELLAAAGLKPGSVHVRLTEDGLEILSRPAALARAQAILAPYIPKGRSLVDEFIADRRREAERE
jgi:bifunctional DNA-binding transcriptional regulator/antitoxin component of YhaV-PrlF toxin-antitoxin module